MFCFSSFWVLKCLIAPTQTADLLFSTSEWKHFKYFILHLHSEAYGRSFTAYKQGKTIHKLTQTVSEQDTYNIMQLNASLMYKSSILVA